MRQAYRNRALALLAVVLLFFALDRIVSGSIQSMLLRSSFRYSLLYRGAVNADVVVIGNSRGTSSVYIPAMEEATSVKCFNLSYNGLGAPEVTELLRDFLKHNRKPKLVLLEASCLSTSSPANLSPFWRYSDGLSANAERQTPMSFYAGEVTELYRLNAEMTYRALFYLNRTDQGYANRRVASASMFSDTEDPLPAALVMPSDESMRPVRELLEIARTNEISLCIYLAPYHPGYVSAIENLDPWITKYKSYIGETPFLDLSRVVTETDHFADRLHNNWKAIPVIMERMEQFGAFRNISEF